MGNALDKKCNTLNYYLKILKFRFKITLWIEERNKLDSIYFSKYLYFIIFLMYNTVNIKMSINENIYFRSTFFDIMIVGGRFMITILVVEDDDILRLLIKTKLSTLYQIEEAANGKEALEVLDHNHVDLLIVDIQMPQMNGYELVRILRECNDKRPIIMLTAMTSHAHKKEGFASGIDDYMTKPIDYEELTWRIEALLRRANISNEKKIKIGDFLLNQNEYYAEYNGKQIVLTNKEFDLLFLLLSYPGVVFTKQELMDNIWGFDSETEYDTIKTYISKLRNKFSECSEFELVSIRGLGYKALIRKAGVKI